MGKKALPLRWTFPALMLLVSCMEDRVWGEQVCCKEISWESDWCHREECYGQGCAPGSDSVCSSLDDCLCRSSVDYDTRSSCTTILSCDNARRDYNFAQDMVQLYNGLKASERCREAITEVTCAYHFPLCVSDTEERRSVCSSSCKTLQTECNITLAYFARDGSRCQAASDKSPCTSAVSPFGGCFASPHPPRRRAKSHHSAKSGPRIVNFCHSGRRRIPPLLRFGRCRVASPRRLDPNALERPAAAWPRVGGGGLRAHARRREAHGPPAPRGSRDGRRVTAPVWQPLQRVGGKRVGRGGHGNPLLEELGVRSRTPTPLGLRV
ncbi:hypothetical protein T484DRAFT_1928018 [Baffinella frigidus]|nr:hypothetical protein T484DRAFT_1928018 [Cryptophyta sp. CCMP2293]|mmetsp:Transcript_48816/g.115217  ORF Transcript_48816/g.115217 Transcript_48816/m.115217 type:complete len:323 (+) Transcript_48816:28-996(+)